MKIIFALFLCVVVVQTQAATIELNPNKDNTLYETNLIGLSNGAGDYFFVGRTAQGSNELRRGLLQFDLSMLPPGTTINDVTLEMTSSRTISTSRTITVHSALKDWGESTSDAAGQEGAGANAEIGDATWTNAFLDGAAWDTAGGDFDPAQLAATDVTGDQTISFNDTDLTAEVQNWVDSPMNNFGVVVLGDESETRTAFRFNSRENSTNPPKLIIDFTLTSTELQLEPSKDNTLYETVDGSTSNGAGDRVFIGQIQSGLTRRALLEFDVSGIPGSATINSVTLDLIITNIPGSAQNGNAALHFATNEWGAAGSNGSGNGAPSQTGDATWIHTSFDTDDWITAGGDFMPTASATASYSDVDTSINFVSNSSLVADVTTWIQNANDNHGWIMLGDETNFGNARGIGSADNNDANNRPVLTIEYTVIDLIFENGFE